mmetsp:Transcript_17671/g.48871  ORF Transcript_17671/g.48871 Transcript_17671/m.48871 type:complete len:241 (-) Transcript_17671:883-1605(-)
MALTSVGRGESRRISNSCRGLSMRWLPANKVIPSLDMSKASPLNSVPERTATGADPARRSQTRICLSRPPETKTSGHAGLALKLSTFRRCAAMRPSPLHSLPKTALSTKFPPFTWYTVMDRDWPATSTLSPSLLKASAFNSLELATLSSTDGCRPFVKSQSPSVPAVSTVATIDFRPCGIQRRLVIASSCCVKVAVPSLFAFSTAALSKLCTSTRDGRARLIVFNWHPRVASKMRRNPSK